MRTDAQRLDDMLSAAAVIRSSAPTSHAAPCPTVSSSTPSDTDHAFIQATIDHDLPPLVAATERLTQHLASKQDRT